jgi:hypothetical protein
MLKTEEKDRISIAELIEHDIMYDNETVKSNY